MVTKLESQWKAEEKAKDEAHKAEVARAYQSGGEDHKKQIAQLDQLLKDANTVVDDLQVFHKFLSRTTWL